MRIKFIEQWKFRLAGRAVPTVKAEDITDDGMIGTIHLLGDCRMRANSIINTWDSKGWEITKDSKKITLIDEKGISKTAFVVSDAGISINLYTQPSAFPNREDIVGKAATMDDIADAMDLGKSMRNIIIGGIVSAPVWWILFQVLGQMMK